MSNAADPGPRALECDRTAVAVHSALGQALDRIRCGVIVTSIARRPCFINAHAHGVLAKRDALMLVDGVLHARMAEDTKRLQRALDAVAESQSATTVTLSIQSATLVNKLCMHVLHVHNNAADSTDAVLFVCDPTITLTVSQPSLRTLFGLTRAEAVFADLIGQGCSLETAADRLCVSIHTARTHVKRIMLKTDTGRQGELLRLMFVCAGVVSLD